MKLPEIIQMGALVVIILIILRISLSNVKKQEMTLYCLLISIIFVVYLVVNKEMFNRLYKKFNKKDSYSNFPDIAPETNIEFGSEEATINQNANSITNMGKDKCKYNLCCAEKSEKEPVPVVNNWYNSQGASLEYNNAKTMMGCSSDPKYTDIGEPANLNSPPIGKWGDINIVKDRSKLLKLIPGLVENKVDPECGWRRSPCNIPLDMELAKKVEENDKKYGVNRKNLPSVDGNKDGPRSLFTFAYNQSNFDCCPSTYSNSTGCICEPLNQMNYISKRGKMSN